MRIVYLVAHINWETHEILSGWTQCEAAEAEVARLMAEARIYGGTYEIEELPLDVRWSDQVNERAANSHERPEQSS